MKQDKNATRPSGVSRRTVVKGAAWAVPAITVASAVPAMAASVEFLTFSGAGCKLPGNSNPPYVNGNAFALSVNNSTSDEVTIAITEVRLNGVLLGNPLVINLSPCDLLGNPFTVDPWTVLSNVALVTSDAPNASNGTLSVTYTVSGAAGTATASVASVPPIQGASCTAFTNADRNCILSVI